MNVVIITHLISIQTIETIDSIKTNTKEYRKFPI